MNHRLTSVFIVSLAVLAGCDQSRTTNSADSGTASGGNDAPAATATADTASPVLATVNGSAITAGVLDVYARQRKVSGGNRTDDQEAILDELVSLELMRQEGVKNGLGAQPQVVATLDQQQRTVLAGAAIQEFMKNNPVTDEAIKEMYDTQMGTPGDEFNARHILVETEEAAGEVIKLLDSGSDFSELAKEKSTGPSGSGGGKLGWFGAGQMVKPFADATAALEKGSYTKTPVKTQFGWHVIILDDTRASTPPPFDDVKARIKMMLANEQLQKHIEEIKSAAAIDIKE